MRKAIRIALLAATAVMASAFWAVSPARGDVSFHGTFRGPHGAFSIGIGSPYFPVGSYLPHGHRVAHRPRYGYGFWSPVFVCRAHHLRHAHWVPVRRHRARWIVVERPTVVIRKRRFYDGYDSGHDGHRDGYRHDDGGYYGYGHGHGDGYGYGDRYERRYKHRSRHEHGRYRDDHDD